MKKMTMFAIVALGLVSGVLWGPTGSDPEPQTTDEEGVAASRPSIFLRPVSPELEEEIQSLEASISEEHAVNEEQSEELVGELLALDLEYSTLQAFMKFKATLTSLVLGIIPVVGPICLDADPDTRNKACFALGSLLLPHERWHDDYPKVEAAVLPYFLRFLLDADPSVRQHAVALLAVLVREHWPDPDPRALAALVVSAVTDPEELVRLRALRQLKWLGLPLEHPKLGKRVFR